ncbi:FecR domain-containing protein [Niabella sp.]|uniref:FecR family protein n=1 Tax=Niabella sp. TaxID=1962976 RepID=UPI0026348FDB|nr:FecR domain-containing protein [Niabella sp.]
MSSNPARLDLLFKKYIDSSCTPSELEEFWQLLSELTDNERLAIGLHDVWYQRETRAILPDAQWDKAYARLHNAISQQMPKTSRVAALRHYRRWVAAAAILLLLAGSYWFFGTSRPGKETGRSAVADGKSPAQPPVRVLTLPDGTVVTLGQQSELYYDASFTSSAVRRVKITGDAYFDVMHDAQRPFVVSTGSYDIKVLGTAFDIRTNNGKFQITVTRGKVRVDEAATQKPVTVLLPGNQLTIQGTAKAAEIATQIDSAAVTRWTRQDLTFNDDTWQTAATLIRERFGVDVVFLEPALAACRFTGDFSEKSLNDCLDIICMLTHSGWHRKGSHTIEIDGPGCK